MILKKNSWTQENCFFSLTFSSFGYFDNLIIFSSLLVDHTHSYSLKSRSLWYSLCNSPLFQLIVELVTLRFGCSSKVVVTKSSFTFDNEILFATTLMAVRSFKVAWWLHALQKGSGRPSMQWWRNFYKI